MMTKDSCKEMALAWKARVDHHDRLRARTSSVFAYGKATFPKGEGIICILLILWNNK